MSVFSRFYDPDDLETSRSPLPGFPAFVGCLSQDWFSGDPTPNRVAAHTQSEHGIPKGAGNAGSYRPSFPNPSSTTTSMSVGPPLPVDSAMAGPMSSGSVSCMAATPIERASPTKSMGGSLNSMPV